MKALIFKIGDKLGVDRSGHRYYCTYFWEVVVHAISIVGCFALLGTAVPMALGLLVKIALIGVKEVLLSRGLVDNTHVTHGEVVVGALVLVALICLVTLTPKVLSKLMERHCEEMPQVEDQKSNQ